MNILVCDDDREICEAIGIYLGHEGHTVLQAHSGVEALSIAGKHDLQLIIMDVMMPGLDGLRATLKIREQSNVPILMLSAKSEDTDKFGCPFH